MNEPTTDGLTLLQPTTSSATGRSANGNDAPPWLDDATNARFTHYERLPLHAMVGLDPEIGTVLDAHFIGCSPQRLREIRQDHSRALATTAASLLADEELAADLRRLVEITGPRIVVLGDSITADSLGWADLLAACLRAEPQKVGGEIVRVVNLAVSGFTTSETFPLFTVVVRERPTCVLVMLGTNDGRRQGAVADVRTMTPSETERNFHALRTLTHLETGARFVCIAPPPMNQARYESSLPADPPARATSEDLAATQVAIRAAVADLIDLSEAPGVGEDEDFWLRDGIHPSEQGQAILLRHIVHALAQLT